MARVPMSERTRNELKEMFAGKRSADRSGLVRQAARLIVEEALEAEAGQELGRGYYEHGAGERGYRNGYRVGKVKSAEGVIEFAVPQVSDTAEPFRSQIRQVLRGRTEELERLAVEMYARGLSVRDIEAAFTDETGRCALTKSAASELTERLWADYQAFASRDLAEFKVLYLFVDGIAERLHLGQPREAVLAAWAITESGSKVLLGLAPGTKEDTASCRDFLRDLKARNLADPILVATDGAPGLIRAVEEVFPKSLRQRCLAHKMRNLEAKVPGEVWRELKGAAYAAYQAGSPKLAAMAKDDFVTQYERDYPSATTCFLDNDSAAPARLGMEACWGEGVVLKMSHVHYKAATRMESRVQSVSHIQPIAPLVTGAAVSCAGGTVEVVSVRLIGGPATVGELARCLSDTERQRASRFVFDRDRRRFIVGRAQLRRLLAARLGVRPESVELTYGAHGKPSLARRFADSDLRFNVSHSGDLAVYAFASGREVGIDVEAVRVIRNADDIAARFFSRCENEAYLALDPRDRPKGFFNCWTRKEAFIKALGDGLYHPLYSFDVSLVPGEPAQILRIGNISGDHCGWQVCSFAPLPGYVAAVVIESTTRQADSTVYLSRSDCLEVV